jgi:hypothetical protein
VPPGNRASGAGTRASQNSISLDGISIMNNLGSYATISPNADALDSVQTQNGNYTAQYGDYLGVHINMVSKSGGNSVHGTAYDYLQNDALNSWGFVKGATKPKVRLNIFGGVVSGPIWKDKAFVLGSYEGIRQSNSSANTGRVLTDRMRSLDFSQITAQLVDPTTRRPIAGNRLDQAGYATNPIATRLLTYLTRENLPSATQNFNGNAPATLNQDSTMDRVDYTPSEKIRLFGRFAWQKIEAFNGSINPANGSGGPTNVRNGAFGYTHILTPNLINDLRLGFNVIQTNALNYFATNGIDGAGAALGIPGFNADVTANNPGLPSFNITGYQGLTGADGTNWYQDDRTLTFYDQLSYTRGKHSFMAGVSIRRLTIGRAAQNQPRGAFTFNGQYTGDAAADFLLGLPSSTVTPATQIKGSTGQMRDGFFVQDTWQLSQKLTLQLGVRYELPQVAYSLNGAGRILTPDRTAIFPQQGGTNAANAQSFPGFKYTNPNQTNLAPRVGLAYRVTDKTVVRAGGGIYYNANHLNAFTLSSGNYPYSAVVTYPNTQPSAGVTPAGSLSNPTPGSGNASPVAGIPGTYVNFFHVDPNLPTSRMYQWNLDVGQEVWRNAGFELQYLGSRTIHLDESYYPNTPTPTPGRVFANTRRPNQLFGNIRQVTNDGFATYNALTAILRQRLTHGLTLTGSYTWSHALDTSDDLNGGSNGSAMWQGNLRLDYGNSNIDVRNRFVATVTYELPKLQGHNLLMQETLGGWQVNGILDLRSGSPINVNFSSDVAGTGQPGSPVRPVYLHAPRNTCDKSFYFANRGGGNCIDATAYAVPAQGTYGNVKRNDQYGPKQIAANSVSLFKNFKIVEGVTFQFRAEAFNLMNHANLQLAAANVVLSGTAPTAGAPINPNFAVSSTFGNLTPSTTFQTNRTVQLAGKINF